MKTTDEVILVKETFPIALEKVWEAITEVSQMRQWFFDNIPDFKAVAGFSTQFAVQSEERTFTHLWTIKEAIPFQKLVYQWQYSEYPGEAEVIFKLTSHNNTTTLTLTNTVLQDFPSGIPEFTRASCLGGWQYFIQQQLKAFLTS